MKNLMRAAIVTAAAPLFLSTAAYGADSKNRGYLTDRSGNIVEARSGGCVRTREWAPERADSRCKASAEAASRQNRLSK